MTKPLAHKRIQKEKMNAAHSAWQVMNTTLSKNLIDLSSSEEYEDTNSDGDDDSDDDFVEDDDELDNDEGEDSIINRLAASEADIKKKKNKDVQKYILGFLHALIKEKKSVKGCFSRNTQPLAINDDESIEDHGFSDGKCDNSESEEELLLDGQEKMEASETVVKVVNDGLWLTRCIRKWANICMKGELISLSLRRKMFTKSLLHDELISLQLAAYLLSQKFKATPELVKNYLNQHILSQLNIRPVQHISI
ncbi:11886_t:CDS:2 [Cetraspora pellucida]|uniref:11886_t:CDS:1 n=1 Tax=Cetraspora pellucida TaxID=1433469 RepID=A0ACA9LYY5_9GLOM|nr:11886_t:CDS:2 [Cetraspora pellucida]